MVGKPGNDGTARRRRSPLTPNSANLIARAADATASDGAGGLITRTARDCRINRGDARSIMRPRRPGHPAPRPRARRRGAGKPTTRRRTPTGAARDDPDPGGDPEHV